MFGAHLLLVAIITSLSALIFRSLGAPWSWALTSAALLVGLGITIESLLFPILSPY